MFPNLAIATAVGAAALVLIFPKLRKLQTWRASLTPLASIIGSGFLVLGPILYHAYGQYAPIVMAGLCITAYLFGAAIRYNIARSHADNPNLATWLDTASSGVLGVAYIISVAYYLNLFGAFAVSLTPFDNATNARLVTTAVFGIILIAGWTGGFRWLERMEFLSVTLKLSIIAGLLIGMTLFFADRFATDNLVFSQPAQTGFSAIAIAFGLLVTVQGFETSRYLGDEYDAATRRRSMRWAQWLSTAIYMAYILLLAFVFQRGEVELSETAIVDMMAVVAPILPALLVVGALASQFSAAVADTGGSGGLIEELTSGWISVRLGYAILVAIGIALTWWTHIFQIISYASRAFAAYYALQSGLAAATAYRGGEIRKSFGFAVLAALGVAIGVLGQPAEGY